MITITEKEKQYLLFIDAERFIDRLYSKSIFYELLQYDIGYKNDDTKFKIVTVIGLYNFIVNIIDSNVPEALNLRHNSTNKTRKFKVYRDLLITFSIKFCDYDSWQLTSDEYFQKYYEYIIEFNNFIPLAPPQICKYIIKDTLLLKGVNMFNHRFLIHINDDIYAEFISKMLILYNDFVDNIPI